MKKTLSNLKQVNHFIEETEKNIQNVKGWKEPFCKPGEKEQELAQLEAILNKHKEVKKTVLQHLIVKAQIELNNL